MWTLQDAKNRFSAVVDAALRHQPQVVTKRGRPSVVVVSIDDYERLQAQARATRPSFVDHLLSIPQAPDEFDAFPRLRAAPRPVDDL
jgi:prevent-host-death family protein